MQGVATPSIIIHQSRPQYKVRDFRLDPIIATLEKYCYPSQIKCKVHNKNLSPTLKFVDVASGNLLFKCEGKVFSLSEKKVIKDGESNQVVVTIKKELLTLAGIYKFVKGQDEICKILVERNGSKAILTGEFKNVGGPVRKFLVKANLGMKRCCVYLQEESLILMATMERTEQKGAGSLLGDDEYLIEIEAGVDVVFVLGLCVAVMEENSGHQLPPFKV